MDKIKVLFNKFINLAWYYQLLLIVITSICGVLFYYVLKWIVGILALIFTVIFVITDGEIFSNIGYRYKQQPVSANNPLTNEIYYWLTETGVSNLPISTLVYRQGVEFINLDQGMYSIHLSSSIDDKTLEKFETQVRQKVCTQSNNLIDCIISRSKKEPYENIIVRLCDANKLVSTRAQERFVDF